MKPNYAQKGALSPILLVVVGIIVVVGVVLVASGVLKFNAKVSPGNNQYSVGSNPSSTPQENPSSQTKTYTNATSGVTLNYPSGWSMKENPGTGVIVAFGSPKESSSDKFVDNVNVSTYELSSKPNITLKQLTDSWLNETEQTPTFKLLDRKSTTLARESAEQLTYTFSQGGVDIKGMVVITLKGKAAYIVTYTAEATSYDKFADSANTVVSSLQVSK